MAGAIVAAPRLHSSGSSEQDKILSDCGSQNNYLPL